MSDINKVTEYLRAHLPEHILMDILEKPADKWGGRCMLDMIKDGHVDEVLKELEEAFNQ